MNSFSAPYLRAILTRAVFVLVFVNTKQPHFYPKHEQTAKLVEYSDCTFVNIFLEFRRRPNKMTLLSHPLDLSSFTAVACHIHCPRTYYALARGIENIYLKQIRKSYKFEKIKKLKLKKISRMHINCGKNNHRRPSNGEKEHVCQN